MPIELSFNGEYTSLIEFMNNLSMGKDSLELIKSKYTKKRMQAEQLMSILQQMHSLSRQQ